VIAPVVVTALGNGNHAVAMIDAVDEMRRRLARAHWWPMHQAPTPIVERRRITFTMSFPFRSAATIKGTATAKATITATTRRAAGSKPLVDRS